MALFAFFGVHAGNLGALGVAVLPAPATNVAFAASARLVYTVSLERVAEWIPAERHRAEQRGMRASDLTVRTKSPWLRAQSDPMQASALNETARDRLRVTFELIDVAERMLRRRLRRECPDLSDEALEEGIAAWYGQRRGAELGDAEGVSVQWPRRPML